MLVLTSRESLGLQSNEAGSARKAKALTTHPPQEFEGGRPQRPWTVVENPATLVLFLGAKYCKRRVHHTRTGLQGLGERMSISTRSSPLPQYGALSTQDPTLSGEPPCRLCAPAVSAVLLCPMGPWPEGHGSETAARHAPTADEPSAATVLSVARLRFRMPASRPKWRLSFWT